MKTILVSLISEQTLPNILIAIHYKPDIFWFISSARMEKERRTKCIDDTLKLKKLLISDENVKKIIVNQDSLTDCMNKMENLTEEIDGEVEYIVNITGGTKLMALAALEVFREIGQKVTIGYMPLGKNKFVQIFPKKRPLKVYEIEERLNLEEYLRGYGFIIENKQKLPAVISRALRDKDRSAWILENYEQLKPMLDFFYKSLRKNRDRKKYHVSEMFDRKLTPIEKKFLIKFAFEEKNGLTLQRYLALLIQYMVYA